MNEPLSVDIFFGLDSKKLTMSLISKSFFILFKAMIINAYLPQTLDLKL